MKEKRRRTLMLWTWPILISLGTATTLMLGGRLLDIAFMDHRPAVLIRDWLFVTDASQAQSVILSSLEMLSGVFAITITVVAIIVQLSADRYTSRVVDLFLSDPFTGFIFFAYVIPMTYGMWLANVITPDEYSGVSIGIFYILSTVAVIIVIPYFKFVFYFLHPTNIISKIERSMEQSIQRALTDADACEKMRGEVTNSIRQLSDISLSSISQSDIVLSLQCLNSIKETTLYYLEHKQRMPNEWFEVGATHFVGMSDEMWRETRDTRTWLEMEVFKQYEIAFTHSLRKYRDVNSFVSRNLREVAERAAVVDSDATLAFFIKCFNTMIMYALSERDIRSAVHVLYQYRLLSEALLYRPDVLEKVANHMKYYAHNSQRRRIYFIMDAVAYDLRVLIELTYTRFPEGTEPLLNVFLELDQVAESKEDLSFLRGVRKSQAMVAGFFIRNGRVDLAMRIHDDMKDEPKDFLATVRRDLFSSKSKEFWEIDDRGVTFYHVDEHEQDSVNQFFRWLLEEEPRPEVVAQSA